jgi:hypothetical protein
MQVPVICFRGAQNSQTRWRRRGSYAGWVVGMLFALGVGAVQPGSMDAEKKQGPWVQLSLDSLGFPGVSGPFLTSGSSMLTVHLLDGKHLLVTYSLRTLVPRLPGDPVDHDDRLVAGEVVDLPSGHVVARAEWHMHDHGRYLWKLGGGRFLLRIGERLYTIAPMANLASGDAFLRAVFPTRGLPPSLVFVSPEGGVVTIETMLEAQDETRKKVVLGDEDTAEPSSKTLIDFFRVQDGKKGGGDFEVKPAGTVLSPTPLLLPVDADGYLWAQPLDNADWAVTFDGYGGKTIDLGKMESSCRPRLQMTARSEFLALTCLGSDDHIKMASYGLDGRETWEEVVGDVGTPTFAFAPEAARFAMSSTHVDVTPVQPGSTAGPPVPTQEVRVYQNASGDLLLRAECTPAFKTAENFDLSDDGMLAAVVKGGAVAIYKLPALTRRDLDDMAEVASFAPPASTEDVVLKRLTRPVTAEMVAESRVAATSAAAAPASAPTVLVAPMGAIAQGDTQSGPRKRPTLLNPGEKPEFGSGNEPPN